MISRKEFLAEYLNWFWLRPENAILLAIRADEYKSTFKYFGDKALDVSCGDGVFSFIAGGGRFDIDSDMFQSIDITKKRFVNFDAFDMYDEKLYNVKITKSPSIKYSHGTDWKKNLLHKADKLKFYKNLLIHDNNNSLPFENDCFDYVFSNSTYWIECFENHINDLIRVLKPGGHLVLEVKTKNIEHFSAFDYANQYIGQQACEILDAGRRSTWKGLRSINEYKSIFYGINNVKIVEEKPIYGDLMAYLWDIGLRPIFNPLAKLANNVDYQIRRDVKKEWCQIFYDLTEHLVINYKANEEDAIEWLFVLSKGR